MAGAYVHAEDDYALCKAAEKGHTETVRKLLLAEINIHAWNDKALLLAAENAHRETVQVLLQAGADVHINSEEALRTAAKNGHTEIVQVLLQAGADVHTENDHALCIAVEFNRISTVRALLQAGANTSGLSFQKLKKVLTPKFLLSLPSDVVARIEASHLEAEKYRWCKNISLFNSTKREKIFDIKISLADFYYRPGGPGYYQAIFIS